LKFSATQREMLTEDMIDTSIIATNIQNGVPLHGLHKPGYVVTIRQFPIPSPTKSHI